ncbi:uncharacterized protein, partial [Centruroides vittatus]|uniref:uncharacterized protein n=1 Tax=Centruroides vittatus TaxID=120091 RepID=UPI0035108730
FDIYATAIDLPTKSIPQQRAILLHIIGEKGLEIYNNFHLEENATNPTVDEILAKFTDHFQPYKNTIYSRYVFFSLIQKPGQTVDEFVTELHTKAQECDFGTLTESLIRDRIVLGTQDDSIRQKMLQDLTLTLAKAIDMARASELSKHQLSKIRATEIIVSKMKTQFPRQKDKPKKSNTYMTNKNSAKNKKCHKCLTIHKYGNCPAFGKFCFKCKKKNHFSSACKAKKINEIDNPNSTDISDQEDCLLDRIVVLNKVTHEHWEEVIEINGNPTKIKLDTGADTNVISWTYLKQWTNSPKIIPTKVKAYTFTRKRIPIVGECHLRLKSGSHETTSKFLVVRTHGLPLLSGDACKKLKGNVLQSWHARGRAKRRDVHD